MGFFPPPSSFPLPWPQGNPVATVVATAMAAPMPKSLAKSLRGILIALFFFLFSHYLAQEAEPSQLSAETKKKLTLSIELKEDSESHNIICKMSRIPFIMTWHMNNQENPKDCKGKGSQQTPTPDDTVVGIITQKF